MVDTKTIVSSLESIPKKECIAIIIYIILYYIASLRYLFIIHVDLQIVVAVFKLPDFVIILWHCEMLDFCSILCLMAQLLEVVPLASMSKVST